MKYYTQYLCLGHVKRVLKGKDGQKGAEHLVTYEDDHHEENSYRIDHLYEDYMEGSLIFV